MNKCVIFGCHRILTAHERLCGFVCTEHSGEGETVNKPVDVITLELDVLTSQLEVDVQKLRDTPTSASCVINKQRQEMILSLERSILRLKKLLIRLTT